MSLIPDSQKSAQTKARTDCLPRGAYPVRAVQAPRGTGQTRGQLGGAYNAMEFDFDSQRLPTVGHAREQQATIQGWAV
jgi:hypothetical protein